MENQKQFFSTIIDSMGPIYVQYASWMKMTNLREEIDSIEKHLNKENFLVVCFFQYYFHQSISYFI